MKSFTEVSLHVPQQEWLLKKKKKVLNLPLMVCNVNVEFHNDILFSLSS